MVAKKKNKKEKRRKKEKKRPNTFKSIRGQIGI
jgi:hypothetical protein